jgi:apolipoprotein N-acyltransferase
MAFSSRPFWHKPILLSLLSGVLLFAAWPMSPLTFIIFFAFIPLLQLCSLKISNATYFGCLYLAMLIWNVSTTWWIWYASIPGALSAFLANSLLMCLPWLLYRMVKKKLSQTLSYIALIAFWMLWEYTHLQDWGLSWPWLTVGNVFATNPSWIQWYMYTGVSGGTFWVLAVTIFMYELLKTNWESKKNQLIKKVSTLGFLIIIPVMVSFLLRNDTISTQPSNTKNIVIIQPNIDPYEKLSEGTFEKQLNILIETSKQKIDSNTTLLVWPETALYNEYRFDENNINGNHKLDTLFSFLKNYSKLQLFTGIESYKFFADPTANSRTIPNSNSHYESYNSSVLFDKDGAKQFYHKSMLVPGVETLPGFLGFMSKWFEELGGTSSGYVIQKERTPIFTRSITLAPAICYESIYGEFISKYIKNRAYSNAIITIITNDGWWRNTPGHKQHNAYASLRAIENKCWVMRSANTGISSIVAPNGQIKEWLPYNTNGAIKTELPYSYFKPTNTFYTNHPDLLYKIAVVIAVLLYGMYVLRIFWAKT